MFHVLGGGYSLKPKTPWHKCICPSKHEKPLECLPRSPSPGLWRSRSGCSSSEGWNQPLVTLFVALVLLWPLSHLPAAQGQRAKPTGSARTHVLLARSSLVHHSTPLHKTALLPLSSWGFPELSTPILLGCVFPNSVFHCSISQAEFSPDLHHFNYRLCLLNSTTEQNSHIIR